MHDHPADKINFLMKGEILENKTSNFQTTLYCWIFLLVFEQTVFTGTWKK